MTVTRERVRSGGFFRHFPHSSGGFFRHFPHSAHEENDSSRNRNHEIGV
jgi:hypothetical protein